MENKEKLEWWKSAIEKIFTDEGTEVAVVVFSVDRDEWPEAKSGLRLKTVTVTEDGLNLEFDSRILPSLAVRACYLNYEPKQLLLELPDGRLATVTVMADQDCKWWDNIIRLGQEQHHFLIQFINCRCSVGVVDDRERSLSESQATWCQATINGLLGGTTYFSHSHHISGTIDLLRSRRDQRLKKVTVLRYSTEDYSTTINDTYGVWGGIKELRISPSGSVMVRVVNGHGEPIYWVFAVKIGDGDSDTAQKWKEAHRQCLEVLGS